MRTQQPNTKPSIQLIRQGNYRRKVIYDHNHKSGLSGKQITSEIKSFICTKH